VNPDTPWTGWPAVAVGFCAVVAAFAASATRVGEGFAFGFSAFIAFFGVLAALARNRTPDHWGLVAVGLAMFIVPFLGSGYKPDPGASRTCWVAGGLAMILGGIGSVGDKPPTEYGINKFGSGQAQRSALSFWIGRAALVAGRATVLLGIAVRTTTPGIVLTIGLGGLTAVVAVWSLLAVDPTRDFLALACAGFALLLAPSVGGFVRDKAAWTAWVSGAVVTALGGTGYLRGERLHFAATVRDDAETTTANEPADQASPQLPRTDLIAVIVAQSTSDNDNCRDDGSRS
jgi:hypothetical protein